MLILECSQGYYGRTDGSVTISLRNFVGKGIIRSTNRNKVIIWKPIFFTFLRANVNILDNELYFVLSSNHGKDVSIRAVLTASPGKPVFWGPYLHDHSQE
jgi:hypothetical protein